MWWKTIFRPPVSSAAQPTTPFDTEFLRRLERLALVANRTLRGGLTGTHLSRRRLPAPTVADHRPYTHGDDLRYVDWNAYARQDELHIKMGETEQDIRVRVLLDASGSMSYGNGTTNKWLVARQLAAAIGYCALAQGDRVTVQAFGTTRLPFVGRTRQRGAELLSYLGELKAGGRGDLIQTLNAVAGGNDGGIVVIISDLWHAPELAAGLKLLRTPRWQVVLLHLLHPTELAPELQGDLELVDSETGLTETMHIDAAARRRYDARLQQWCRGIEATCARYGVNYALLTSNEPLAQAMLPYLRTRKVLA